MADPTRESLDDVTAAPNRTDPGVADPAQSETTFVKVNRRFLRGVRVAGEVPSYLYGLVYLLFIPLFALIYTFWIPTEFYHSTATHEKAYRDALSSVEFGLESAIISDLQVSFGGDSARFGDDSVMCIGRIRLQGLDTNSRGYPIFRLFIPIGSASGDSATGCEIGKKTSLEVFNVETLVLSEEFEVKRDVSALEESGWLALTLSPIGSDSELLASFPKAVDESRMRVGPDRVFYAFALSPELNQEIVHLANASLGSPSGIAGQFLRMIHLSSITITTTGYGDIVPLTTRARFLTSAEAIIGLVLIGFFLNAITSARSSAREERVDQGVTSER